MRYNHFDMLPERAFFKVGGKIMPQGGGGGTPTQTTQTASTIPEYAQPYVMQNLGKAQALTDISNNPYQPYQGQMVAGFTPMQTQAFSNLANMQVAPQIQQGTDVANQASQGAMGTANPAMNYGAAGAGIGQLGMQAGMSYGRNAQDPNAVASYMNPYLQNTLQPAQQLLNQQYGMQGANQQGAATSKGAFGGSREALMSGLNEQNRNLAQNQLVSGAYNQAYNTANTNMQQAASLGMQGAQQGIAGINAGLQGVQGAQAGYGLGIQGANALGNLGTANYNQQMGINQAQLAAGNQQQQLQQQGLNTDYGQYQQQLQYPYQQLSFMQGMYAGLPMQNQAQTMYQNPSAISQAAGLGATAYGAYKLGQKEGGVVKKMAKGGKVGDGLDTLGIYNAMRS